MAPEVFFFSHANVPIIIINGTSSSAHREPYLVGVSFASKKFAVIWLNRKHSEFVISICDTKSAECVNVSILLTVGNYISIMIIFSFNNIAIFRLISHIVK